MGEHHHHGHGHHHHHGPPSDGHTRAFAIGIALNSVFVVAEAAAGWWFDSLALLADAGHNLSDVMTLVLAWSAATMAKRRPTERRTYGYRRATILASLASAVLLVIAVIAIVYEAIGRLNDPPPVPGLVVIAVAALGLLINAGTAMLFAAGRKDDLNVRAAFVHMAADALVSLGVVVAGIAILIGGWLWIDPAIGILIGLAILISGWDLLKESLDLAIDAVPRNIDPTAVRRYFLDHPQIDDLHDLHIWGMSTTETALTVHLVTPTPPGPEFLPAVNESLRKKFGIGHSTIQVECRDGAESCVLADPETV